MRKIRKTSSSLIPIIACAILVLFVTGCEDQQKAQKAKEEENKAIATRSIEELWNQRKLDLIDEIYAADFVGHIVDNPDIIGPEGYRALMTMYLNAFPDHRFTIEDLITEGDKVVTRWTSTGTHKGELMGIAPTGAQMTVTGTTIHRIADGKYAEEWSNWDALGMWQQLGVVPPIGQDVEPDAPAEAVEE